MTDNQLKFIQLLQNKVKHDCKDNLIIEDGSFEGLIAKMSKPEIIEAINATSPKTGYEFHAKAIYEENDYIPGTLSITAHKVTDDF